MGKKNIEIMHRAELRFPHATLNPNETVGGAMVKYLVDDQQVCQTIENIKNAT
jgi:hypothetical protein